MSSTSSCVVFLMASLCLAHITSAAADQETRRLLSAKAREVKATSTAEEAAGRELYIDPNAKPSSTTGWNVIVSIICNGKFTTVNTIKLRSAILKLGFPTDTQNFQFGGNAATTNWRSITTFVINIPKATSAEAALAAVNKKITRASLNKNAGLPKANPVVDVIFTPFKA